jgi:hypothetical protein
MSVDLLGTLSGGPVDACAVYEFVDERVGLSTTSGAVAAALRGILRPSEIEAQVSSTSTMVAARAERDGWQLEVDGSLVRGLAQATPIPRVAEEVIATACSAVAEKKSSILVSGAILEKGDVTLALVGDDLDSAKVLGLHLHARGWAAVTFGYGFVGGATLEVAGLRALASMSSTSIDQIPARYRPAIEGSLWYYSGFDLTFYTVDPLAINPCSTPTATLTHVVIVDGALEDRPALTTDVDDADIGPLRRHPLIQSLCIASLTLGTPIASCGAVERWALGYPARFAKTSSSTERTYES